MNEFIQMLRRLDAAMDREGLEQAVTELIANIGSCAVQPTHDEAFEILEILIERARKFELAAKLAGQLMLAGKSWPCLIRSCGQALIETGQPHAALHLLEVVRNFDSTKFIDLTADQLEFERLAASAQAGRAYKDCFKWFDGLKNSSQELQRFQEDALEKSYDAYKNVFDRSWKKLHSENGLALDFYRGPGRLWRWSGANLLILADLAKDAPSVHQDLTEKLGSEAGRVANQLVRILENLDTKDPATLATLGRAYLALGKRDDATRNYGRMVDDPNTGLGQLHRTLKDFSSPALGRDASHSSKVIELELTTKLKARIAEQDFEHTDFSQMELEFIRERFDGKEEDGDALPQGIFSIHWLMKGFEYGRNVAAIFKDKNSKESIGTGFLLDGAQVDERLAGVPLLVSCNHVVSDGSNGGGINYDNVCVRFKLSDHPNLDCRLQEIIAADTREDFTVARIAGLPYSKVGKFDLEQGEDWRKTILSTPRKPNAFIIGHPLGGKIAVSLDSLQITGQHDKCQGGSISSLVHYQIPTAGGNSGSPVFDRDWKVIALHQARYGDLNERQSDFKCGLHFGSLLKFAKRDFERRWGT